MPTFTVAEDRGDGILEQPLTSISNYHNFKVLETMTTMNLEDLTRQVEESNAQLKNKMQQRQQAEMCLAKLQALIAAQQNQHTPNLLDKPMAAAPQMEPQPVTQPVQT
ncbi:hypothetical protein CROQUDRAFT_130479 [Cronartium quercuum f. sp. fusiforme G11]|uniref:Uncharacterized protein n=1 Tax=Cronartium quercuum f. sp. fusiforme G11 TaxID=708437 RepID=A0A9P6NRP8_9BASI|nr:hypothetical protein CROQUDRAFT_130479 [Cronartium quercuum f. sp. fusiforme G11]